MDIAFMWSLPVIALATYVFAFQHYKFRSQIILFFLIIAFTAQLVFVVTTEGKVCGCIGLGFVSVINVLRFTAPQL